MRLNLNRNTLWIRGTLLTTVVASLAVVTLGCGGGTSLNGASPKTETQTGTDQDVLETDTPVESSQSEIRAVLALTPFEDSQGVGTRDQTLQRAVINTAAGYQRYFGHAAPASVNFAAGDVVLFYAAGPRRTGGYSASFLSASSNVFGTTLLVTTQWVSPGKDCMVTEALSAPYALAKVRPSRKPWFASFKHTDVVKDCARPFNPCETVKCSAGYHCEAQDVQCITTPCHPIGACVKDDVEPPPPVSSCAAVLCPVGTTCVEKSVQCFKAPCPAVAECVPLKGEPCGGVTCGAGLVCCNPSCNMCTRPNEACIQIACN